jgi:hypothetical protein
MMLRRSFVIGLGALMLHLPCEAASNRSAPLEVLGTYLNEGRSLIEIDLVSKDGRETTNIPLPPGRIDHAAIGEGQTRIYTPAEEIAKRRLLSTIPTPTLRTAPEFFEKETRTFYFRITEGKVILVKPRDLTASERKRLKAFRNEIERLKKAGAITMVESSSGMQR